MAKNRKLRKQAEAEAQARKEKAIAEGTYDNYNEKNKPVEQQTQTVETVSTPGFENTQVVSTGDNPQKLTEASDVITQNQETSKALESPFLSKRVEAGLGTELSPGEIDASILDYQTTIGQKENAEEKINTDATLAKMDAIKANDPATAAAIDETKQELLNRNATVGQEIIDESADNVSIMPKLYAALTTPSEDGGTYVTNDDLNKAFDEIDIEAQYGMTPEVQEKMGVLSKLINSGRISTSEPAIEKLGLTDYYPDINQPLAKGSYSGSIVGSNTIYTANGAIFPQGVYDARKRALQGEALKKKQQQQKLLEMASLSAAPQYKQGLENLKFGKIQDFITKTGGNININDPRTIEFYKDLNKLDNVGNQTLWIQKRADDLLKLMQDEKAYIPDTIKNTLNQWWSGGYFDPSDVVDNAKKLKELNGIYSKLKDYDNMTYYVSQNLKNIQQDVVPMAADWSKKIEELPADKQNELLAVKQSGDFNHYLQLSMKYIPDLRVGEWINGMYKTHDFGVPKEEFANYVWSHIGKEIIPKISTQQNRNFDYWKANKEAQAKVTFWETVAHNTQSTDVRNVMANAGAMNGKDFLNNLSKAAGGLTVGQDDKGIFFTHQLSADEKIAQPVAVGSETFTDRGGQQVDYATWVSGLPKKKKDLGFNRSIDVIDYDQIPKDQVPLVEYLEKNDFNPNTTVKLKTTAYKTRPMDVGGNYLDQETLSNAPGLANDMKTVTEREGVFIVPGNEVVTYSEYNPKTKKYEEKTRLKDVEVSTATGIRVYDNTNFGDISQRDEMTKQTQLNKQIPQNQGVYTEQTEKNPGAVEVGAPEL